MTHYTPGQPQNPPLQRNSGPAGWQIGRVTAVLIGISVVVALMSSLGENYGSLRYLLFVDVFKGPGRSPFAEILHGQVWRLLTPIFIHFGIAHIVFNMMCLKDLGTMLEKRYGMSQLFMQVVVMGVLSNVAQCLWSGPVFGGMSGVIYGLFGYAWMKAKFDPTSRLVVPTQTVIFVIGWYFLCMTGALGNIGNASHTVGLVVGAVWGLGSAKKIFGKGA